MEDMIREVIKISACYIEMFVILHPLLMFGISMSSIDQLFSQRPTSNVQIVVKLIVLVLDLEKAKLHHLKVHAIPKLLVLLVDKRLRQALVMTGMKKYQLILRSPSK